MKFVQAIWRLAPPTKEKKDIKNISRKSQLSNLSPKNNVTAWHIALVSPIDAKRKRQNRRH